MQPKNLSELRDIAFEQINKLINNKIDPEQALAFCGLANVIVASVKVEIEYLKTMDTLEERVPIDFMEHQKVIPHKI